VITRIIGILAVCFACTVFGVACQALDTRPAATQAPSLPGQATGVFTTARPSVGQAFADFFQRRPEPVQPIEFPHNTHIQQGLTCTEYCHENVTRGPVAGLPSVQTCMICHVAIATDRPRIQEITALSDKGLDLNWQRVYGWPNESHVKFNHAPHIRAEVECATCHGDVAAGTVATREVSHTMGFCVNCHNERQASVDCLTCHF
jgi:hypothetical protein